EYSAIGAGAKDSNCDIGATASIRGSGRVESPSAAALHAFVDWASDDRWLGVGDGDCLAARPTGSAIVHHLPGASDDRGTALHIRNGAHDRKCYVCADAAISVARGIVESPRRAALNGLIVWTTRLGRNGRGGAGKAKQKKRGQPSENAECGMRNAEWPKDADGCYFALRTPHSAFEFGLHNHGIESSTCPGLAKTSVRIGLKLPSK